MTVEHEVVAVERWAALAPAASRAQADVLQQHAAVTSRHRARLAAAVGAAAAPAPTTHSCTFPIAAGKGAPEWLEGALVRAVAARKSRWVTGHAQELATVEKLSALLPADLLSHVEAAGDFTLLLSPSVSALHRAEADFDGPSCQAAFLLAVHAARRGVSVPPDVVVSAAVSWNGTALVLEPVGCVEAKLKAVACERPGAKVYVCCKAEDWPEESIDGVDFHPLDPGSSFDSLVEALVPQSAESLLALEGAFGEAEMYFRKQAYEEARVRFEALLERLRRRPGAQRTEREVEWEATAKLRIGAAALHAGRTERARALFDDVARSHGRSSHLLVQETRLNLVGAFIDEFNVAATRAQLQAVERALKQEFSGRREQKTAKTIDLKLEALGARRRLHFLLGEPQKALKVQKEILAWSPDEQQPRSLTDLAECQRRCGKYADARKSLAKARKLVQVMAGPQQLQTLSFLDYYLGLIALEDGKQAPAVAQLREHASKLGPDSAARYRLEFVAQLLEGTPEAIAAMVAAAEAEPADKRLRQWVRIVGLLRGALSRRGAGLGLEQAAARLLKPHLTVLQKRHVRLARAVRAFQAALAKGRDWKPAARAIVAHSAY